MTDTPRDLGYTDISPEDFEIMFHQKMAELNSKDFEGRSLRVLGVDINESNLRVYFEFISEEEAKKEKASMN